MTIGLIRQKGSCGLKMTNGQDTGVEECYEVTAANCAWLATLTGGLLGSTASTIRGC